MAIQFLNNVNADNGVLYVDAINNSVGIGTTNPQARLVVTSSNLDDANTLKINHTRNDANVSTKAVEVDMNLSGADTTTFDRSNYGIFVDLDSSADGDATDEHRIYGVGSDVRFTGFSDLARGAYFYVESNNNTEKTASIAGVEAKVIHDSNSTNGGVSNMYGVFGSSNIQDLGDVDNAYGGYFTVELGNNRGSADFGVSKGVEGHINIDKASTVNYGAMTAVSGIIDNNEGTVPNFGNQYLFKGDYQGTKGSNAYGIYTEGDKHYFDGNIGIGNTAPTSRLTVKENGITTKIATVTIGDTTAGASLTLRGGSPTIYFDRTGTAPENKILMDYAGLEFKTGTLDAEGDVDFKIKADGKLQAPAYTQGFLQSDASGNIEISGGGTLPGGPYLPLDGGTMTGDLLMDGKAGVGNVIGLATGINSNAMSLKLYTYNNIDPGGGLGTSTGNMIQADLGSNLVLRQTANDGDITFQSDDGSGGIATYFQLDGSHMQSIAWKDIHFVDGIKAKFGDYASPDLQIYHDGSNSYIDETGTGNLKIRSNRLQLEKYTGETMAEFIADGASSLYYDNSKKLETTSTGVSVTGTATATTFSGDLNGTINTATTAVTKANATNDTTVATTAFVQNLIGTIPAGLVFQGTWNAATNTPTLASGSGTTGHFYIVSTDGSTNLDGITDWKVGDWAVFVEQGATDAWEKVDNSSVLDGAGTGQTVAMWSGSGTSNTLTNAPITFSGNDATFTGNIHLDNDSSQLQFGDDNDMQIYHNGANGKINNTLGNFNIDSAGDITLDADGGDIRLYDGGVLYGNLANGAGNFQIKNPTQDMDISFIGNDGGSNVTALTLDMSEGGNATFAGDVGIGVSPSQPLDVNGTALIRNTIYVGDDIQHWGDGGTGMYFGTDTISLKNDGGSTRLFVKSGGNVGIGTTSPNYKLEVDGTLGVSRTDGIIFAGSSGLGTGSKIVSNTSNDLIFNTALTSLPYTTTERVRILNNGNVGIGATSPADKLEVKDGSIRLNSTSSYPSTNVIKATWNGSTSPPMGSIGWEQNPGFIGSEWSHYKQTSPYTQARIRLIGDASSGGMFVNLNGSDVFTIKTSTSNVGIGTTNPSQKLDVAGDATFDGRIYTNVTALASVGILGKAIANGWAARYDSNGANYSGFFFNTNHDASMYLRDDSGNTNVLLRSDTTSYLNGGNVGIGTTSPTYKLDVNGDGRFGGTTTSANTALTVRARSGDLGDLRFRFDAAGTLQRSYISDYYTGEASNIGFERNNSTGVGIITFDTSNGSFSPSERMRINSDGNVGIGTTSPTDKLTVQDGNIRLNSTSSYPAQGLYAYWNNSSPNMGGISWHNNPGFIGSEWSHYKQTSPYTLARIRLIGDASTGGMFVNLNSSDVFTIKASTGNVGIGNTNPGAKLDIFNTGASSGSLADCQTYSALTIKPYSSVDSKLTFSANGVSTQLIQATNNASTSGRQISLQPFSGDVGIGVILPSEKLDVNGIVKSSQGYKGYVSDFHNGGFFHSPRSQDGANPLWIPINSTGMSSSDQYYNTRVPLYAGRVRKIILKHVSGSTPVATVCTFYKRINGTTSGTTYTGTVTGGGTAGMKVTFDFGISNFTFNAEDEVQIGVVTGVATQPAMYGMSCQIWYEYNIT